ncbi:zinc finger RNA-binding protein-like [Salvia hispanica]|uniref:zinc finger RNA-binding protein-like n=1 Tax=Salvia hispanica TaxID=49212 RepID=UPI00200972C0|nr:zinc finger RNA-binding protein-like [Salvia hispanica]
MLNAHLRGSMHKSKLEFLRENDTRPLPSGTYDAAEFKGRMPPKEPESSHLNNAWKPWYCDVCKVTAASKSMFNAHLQGSEHKSKLESLKASLPDAKDTGPFSRLHMEPVSAACDLKATYAASEAEEIMPPKETADRRLQTTLKKAQPEWTSDVCKVTTESESMSNNHIQGSQHKSKLGTTLKASLLEAKDTGPSSLQQVQHMQPVSAFVEEEIMPPNEIAEKGLPETPILEKSQREWTSDRCKATNENETTWKQACLSQNIHRYVCSK